MASIQRIPSNMKIGHCCQCGQRYEYSRALRKAPATCGLLRCGREYGELWAKEEVKL